MCTLSQSFVEYRQPHYYSRARERPYASALLRTLTLAHAHVVGVAKVRVRYTALVAAHNGSGSYCDIASRSARSLLLLSLSRTEKEGRILCKLLLLHVDS